MLDAKYELCLQSEHWQIFRRGILMTRIGPQGAAAICLRLREDQSGLDSIGRRLCRPRGSRVSVNGQRCATPSDARSSWLLRNPHECGAAGRF